MTIALKNILDSPTSFIMTSPVGLENVLAMLAFVRWCSPSRVVSEVIGVHRRLDFLVKMGNTST